MYLFYACCVVLVILIFNDKLYHTIPRLYGKEKAVIFRFNSSENIRRLMANFTLPCPSNSSYLSGPFSRISKRVFSVFISCEKNLIRDFAHNEHSLIPFDQPDSVLILCDSYIRRYYIIYITLIYLYIKQ